MFRLIICALLLSGCVAIPASPEENVDARIMPDPESYTIGFVDSAVRFYVENGREKTIEYFALEENMIDQWYILIIDVETGRLITAPDPDYIGYYIRGNVDVTGYAHGIELVSADENGKWVHYVWENPVTNNLHQKHTWAIRQDDLVFASGWYEEEEYKEGQNE